MFIVRNCQVTFIYCKVSGNWTKISLVYFNADIKQRVLTSIWPFASSHPLPSFPHHTTAHNQGECKATMSFLQEAWSTSLCIFTAHLLLIFYTKHTWRKAKEKLLSLANSIGTWYSWLSGVTMIDREDTVFHLSPLFYMTNATSSWFFSNSFSNTLIKADALRPAGLNSFN